MRKKLALISVSLLSLFFSFGCVHQTVKMYKGQLLPPEQSATLLTDSKDVTIERINNKKITTIQQLWDNKWNAEVSLMPDKYEIEVEYRNYPSFDEHFESCYLFELETLPGHTYQIKHKVIDKSAKLWITDLNTSERTGKVLASQNEPITELDETLNHSIYFTFHPPQNENWIITHRNNWETALAKYGKNIDETYGLYIILFELPNLESKEDFLDFVKTGRKKDSDPKRFNMLKDEIHYHEEFNDFCVSYHSIAEDTKAVKRSNNKNNMILELAGYVCRHPKNKNIAVNFDYSHRYYKGQEDQDLIIKSKELFDKLNF